jgi:hypothetical protein
LAADLLGLSPTDMGAAALVGLVVLLVLRGQLVPRRQLEDLRQERDTWREAHTVSEEARRDAQDQAGELLELSRTAGALMTALPRAGWGVSASADLDQTPAAPPP